VKTKFDVTDLPSPRRLTVSPGAPRITDRQIEIMTATLCDVIASNKLPPDEGKEAVGLLIRAMVTQVSRLNEAIAEASRSPDVDVKVTNSTTGQPVVSPADTEDERVRAFGRLAL